MNKSLPHCLELIFHSERGFSNHVDDPGGPTQDGITLKTLSAWRRRPCTIEELKQLGPSERDAILTAQYAAPVRFEDLPEGLDYAVLDAAVNSGPNRAGRLLQQALGFSGKDLDGVVGHVTLDAVGKIRDVPHLVYQVCEARLAYMKTLKNWRTFGGGWETRVGLVEREGEEMFAGRAIDLDRRTVLPPEASAQAAGTTKLIRVPSGQAALATAGTVAATAATAAAQASGILQPYADVAIVRNILLGLAVISAGASLVIALTRMREGATT